MSNQPQTRAGDSAALLLEASGRTHVGLERRNNEDAFHVDSGAGFFVVCDGMGGHASGEIASRIAVDTMVRFVTRTVQEAGFRFPFNSPDALSLQTRILDSAVRLANRSVFAEAQNDIDNKGMGTTLVAVLAETDGVGVVHVGDSRLYRYRDGSLEQVTEDHSLLNHYRRTRPMTAEEIRDFRGKNVIVRAVGLRDTVQPEVAEIDLLPGDILLLCTDGLSDLVDDESLARLLATHEKDLDLANSAMIDAALAAGGKDNVTVLLARLRGDHAVRGATARASDDTSPGFRAVGDDGSWDVETMPGGELPTLGGEDTDAVVASSPGFPLDAVTPNELLALTDEDIARHRAQVAAAPSEGPPGLPGTPTLVAGDLDADDVDPHSSTPQALPAVRVDDLGSAASQGIAASPAAVAVAPVLRVPIAIPLATPNPPPPAAQAATEPAASPIPDAVAGAAAVIERAALDPAVDAAFRRAGTRRTLTSRGSGPSHVVESPFARRASAELNVLPGAPSGDLAAGGRFDPAASVGPGELRPSGHVAQETLRIGRPVLSAQAPGLAQATDDSAAVDSSAAGDWGAGPAVSDMPTLRMEAVSNDEAPAHARPAAPLAEAQPGDAAASLEPDPDATP